MHPSPSSPLLPPVFFLLLLLLLPRHAAAGSDAFRSGQGNFMLDVEDAVNDGAAPLATTRVRTAQECQRICCVDPRCNLALVEPTAAAATDNHTCVLFNCVHRNRFVCRVVYQVGYQSFIREDVFLRYLQGPQGSGKQVPPIAIAGRDVVVQPSRTVTLNGIESLAMGHAHITDYSWSLHSGDHSVKMEKMNLPDQVELSNLQPGFYVFQLTVTDSNGQSDNAKVSVLVLSPELSSRFCLVQEKVGLCRASFPRWRYDAQTDSCVEFVFGGCKPNKNNFLSEDECLSACKGVKAGPSERGAPTPAGEVCDTACLPNQLICDSGCCLDRSLECDGVEHCSDGSDEDHCSKLNNTFNRLLNINVNQRKAQCSEPPFTGPCRASLPRWYYNPMNRKCHTFTYGGCRANGNNFDEEKTCSESCDGVTEENVYFKGLFERYEQEEESDSGNIALAVLLSVAILALLAILAYCFLKNRKKRSHQPVSSGPPHEALPEQDTLVYKSTTKPI